MFNMSRPMAETPSAQSAAGRRLARCSDYPHFPLVRYPVRRMSSHYLKRHFRQLPRGNGGALPAQSGVDLSPSDHLQPIRPHRTYALKEGVYSDPLAERFTDASRNAPDCSPRQCRKGQDR